LYLASAYYLINTPDSHIAPQLVRIGGTWLAGDVERMKKGGELSTIMELAAKVSFVHLASTRHAIPRMNPSASAPVGAPIPSLFASL
jgi:hypothetical protein